jgi:hypothetical protein
LSSTANAAEKAATGGVVIVMAVSWSSVIIVPLQSGMNILVNDYSIDDSQTAINP